MLVCVKYCSNCPKSQTLSYLLGDVLRVILHGIQVWVWMWSARSLKMTVIFMHLGWFLATFEVANHVDTA